jgi:hypothetical protein
MGVDSTLHVDSNGGRILRWVIIGRTFLTHDNAYVREAGGWFALPFTASTDEITVNLLVIVRWSMGYNNMRLKAVMIFAYELREADVRNKMKSASITSALGFLSIVSSILIGHFSIAPYTLPLRQRQMREQ